MHVLYEQLMKHADAVERYEEYFTTALALDDDSPTAVWGRMSSTSTAAGCIPSGRG